MMDARASRRTSRLFVPILLAILVGILVIGGGVLVILGRDDQGDETDSTRTQTSASPYPTVSANTDWQPVIETRHEAEMVLVPPGCFLMGNDEGRRDERPAHEVCFEQAFWLDRYEVTNAQYGSPGPFEGDMVPRGNLTWFEARDFCQSRGARLPTEAEWEYAARGPRNFIFPWGDVLEVERVVVNTDTAILEVVGSRTGGESWVGAVDIIGNAMEWVSSSYAPYPYTATDGREDLANIQNLRVYRGGRDTYQEWGVYTTTRFRRAAEERDWFVGFRCAADN